MNIPGRSRIPLALAAAGTVALAVTACRSTTSSFQSHGPPLVALTMLVPDAGGSPSVSGASSGGVSADVAGAPAPSAAVTVSDGQHDLLITDAELLVQEPQLRTTVANSCDLVAAGQSSDSDSCAELLTGPLHISLPVQTPGVGATLLTAVQVDTAHYDALQLHLHPGDPNDSRDASILQQRPYMDGTSVYVKGTYDGQAFALELGIDTDQVLAFPSVDLTADGATAVVQLQVDVASWLTDPGTGAVIDPSTAAAGGANHDVVVQNVVGSMGATSQ